MKWPVGTNAVPTKDSSPTDEGSFSFLPNEQTTVASGEDLLFKNEGRRVCALFFPRRLESTYMPLF